jgi:hypothetical protein
MEANSPRSCIKYFGHYPVLCLGTETISGVVWYAPTIEAVENVRAYESDAYKELAVFVQLKNGDEIMARTFIWNGDEDDLLEDRYEPGSEGACREEMTGTKETA